MEVITKDRISLDKERQAKRIEGYRFKLWMMERMSKKDGSKRIH